MPDASLTPRSYYRSLLRATWAEMHRFSRRQVIVAGIAAGIAFVAHFTLFDTQHALGNLGSALLFPLAALAIVWILIFACKLILAPVNLARASAQKYEKQLEVANARLDQERADG